jgi:thiol-disulfide isomerase/thioredoxin
MVKKNGDYSTYLTTYLTTYSKKIQKQMKYISKPKNLFMIVILLAVLAGLYFIRTQYFDKEGFEANSATTLQSEIKDKDSLVLFYAEWCGHCKSFMNDWNSLGEEVNGTKLVKVNCGEADNPEHEKIRTEYSVAGYPTIKKIDVAGNVTEYEGDRKIDAIKKFLGQTS